MKSLLTLLFALGLATVYGQAFSDQYFKDFAAPSGDEVYMTSCKFDPEAPAVFLRKDATILPDGQRMFKYCRNRIKILKDNGVDEGNIRIKFYHFGGYEKITSITAVTINYDEGGNKKIVPLNQKDIHYTKEDQFYTAISFSMPEVRPGSIIEYSYNSERLSYQMVDYWYFQDELPVLHSSFDYTILPNAEFSYRVLKPDHFPVALKHDKLNGRLIFGMDNLPGIPDEIYMDSKRDYLSRVELQMNYAGAGIDRQKFVNNWQDLTSELLRDEDFGQLLTRRISGTEQITNAAKLLPDLKDRMDLVFNNVQQQLNWNHYIGIYAKDKLKTVWDRKSGSAAEINLVLLNLLIEAGVPAYPLLVSDRGHGRVTSDHPFITQFSKVIAYVEIEGRPYYLDASGNHVQTDLIPESLLNTNAYLVAKKNSRFLTIEDPLHYMKRNINISGKIGGDGRLVAQAFLMDEDYSRIMHEREIRADKDAYVNRNFIKPYTSLQVQDHKVSNLEKDTLALEQLLDFQMPLEHSGDYFLLYPNIFSGMEKNPFVSENRYTDINFGCKRNITFNESFELADGWTIESLPKAMAMRTADTGLVISRLTDMTPDGKRFVVKLKVEVNKPFYEAEEYPAVREFYKKMYGILNEPVVVKRKPQP